MVKTPLNVLIVEDSSDDADLLTLELRRGDYEVTSFRVDTAVTMRTALDQQAWDLVLCDYSMPHFGPVAALEVLREAGQDVPLIIISGTVSEEVAFEALKAGARDFLVKDKLTRLLPAVARELRNAALRRQLRWAEDERLDVLEKYRGFVENTPDGIWLLDHNLRTTYLNLRMADLLGASTSRDVSIADCIVGSDTGGQPGDLREELGKAPQPHQFHVRRLDGTMFWASVAVSRTTATADGEAGYLLMVRDITEFKHMREQLRQAQKMEAVGQLAGGVAHDFNNLLTVILGNAEIVCDALADDHPLRQDVLEIQKAGQQAAALTRQLLSFSRKQFLQPVVLDINVVATRTLQLLRRVIGANIQCVTALDEALGLVEADPAQVEQVLMNLAVNARDAMPDGGQLTVTTANVDLDDHFTRAHLGSRKGPHVMLEVRDTGTGMDEETQQHVFEPFFTTKEAGKGTGLGLSMVYGVVKQSNGYIAVDSTPGVGTAFQVYLPRTTRKMAQAEPQVSRSSTRKTGTILVVEDDARIRDMVDRALKRAGYEVIAASDAQDAIARLKRHAGPLDLLVTDIVMPKASGIDLYRSLALTRPDLPVVYVSGYARDVVGRHVLESGAAFLQKPFTAAGLLAKVHDALTVGHRGAHTRA